MSNVVKLSTAPTTYYTVRKNGPFYVVQLVTPMCGDDLRTSLYSVNDKEDAHRMARNSAAKAKRPFKLRGVVQ